MIKTRRNIYLLLLKTSVWKEVRHFSVQCILTETTWLPTLVDLSEAATQNEYQNFGFQDQLTRNAGQKYCRMQYFRPSLSYHLSLRSLLSLFLSGRLRQVLLYFA